MTNKNLPSLLGEVDQHRRWLRLVSILDACHYVGLTPVSTNSLLVIMYLSEVLAPVWELEPLDGKVLKQSDTPYFPSLQQDVDRLIGMGLVSVDELRIDHSNNVEPLLIPFFSLDIEQTRPLMTALRELPGEERVLDFIREVVQAFSRLSDQQVNFSMNEDATYGNPEFDTGQVIDLGEWINTEETSTSHVIDQFCQLTNNNLTPAEVIDVYVNHIVYRVSNE